MPRVIILLLLFMSTSINSQEIDRIKLQGKIIADTQDKEGVTVFNTSSNKGTITNENGEFTISAKLNDLIEVSALQFEKFIVRVDEKIMTSQKMTVFLIEQINKLDEVVILPYDLSGNLPIDVESVKTFNPNLDAIYFGVDDISAYEFGDDYKSEVKNITTTNGVDNIIGADLFGVVGLLVDAIFPRKNKQKIINDRRQLYPAISTKDLRDIYSTEFIVETFDLSENRVDSFIVFAENNNLDYTLYYKGKELEFLDEVKKQSLLFLKSQRD